MARHREERKIHYYYSYGHILTGYGASMDPHRCGDPSEPCLTVTQQREVTDWETVDTKRIGSPPE